MAAQKVFNLPELNSMILKETINIKSFFLINKCSYLNSKPFFKYYKKYYEYKCKYEDYKYSETHIFEIFEADNNDVDEFYNIKCFCNKKAKLRRVKKQNINLGKLFLNCERIKCKFFRWWNVILQEDFLNNRIYDDSISAVKDMNDVSKSYFKEKMMKQIKKFSFFEMFNLANHLIETIDINEFIDV
ncbi:hypothetical protein F8M41_004068 [Gigaspora margarita]|uniref:GRF-type domain-containing protein n=1 Tax=Gigaspora margarita TaxID=4874 RepID=A0A8H3XCS4_GIGMA|nr:hypothetical protein F8M41_004068 [Gigaspora margarita]